jgi:hypothetical protein
VNKLIVEITEENIIDLDIKIHNDSVTIREEDVTVRMIVDGDNNLKYSFNGSKKGDTYSVRVPRLKGMMSVGERDCFIEVICYDRYFKAWEGVVELQEATKIEVSPKKTNVMENTKIEITPTAKIVEQPKKEENILVEDKEEEKKAEVIEEEKKEEDDGDTFEIIMDRPIKRTQKKIVEQKKTTKKVTPKKRKRMSLKVS